MKKNAHKKTRKGWPDKTKAPEINRFTRQCVLEI
jgi:hypothetical protein